MINEITKKQEYALHRVKTHSDCRGVYNATADRRRWPSLAPHFATLRGLMGKGFLEQASGLDNTATYYKLTKQRV